MRSTDLLSSAKDLVSQQEWVEEVVGRTYRNRGVHLEFSFDHRNLDVGISPSAITKSSLCEKNLFLKAMRKKGNYLDFEGNMRQVDRDSTLFNYVEGRIAHNSMELLIKLVKSNNPGINQVGWKTILSPIINTSIISVLDEIGGLVKPIEIETNVGRIVQLIELTTKKVLCDHIGSTIFDRYSWYEQLASLRCTSELSVKKEEFGGIIDLVAEKESRREIVDYKFVRENKVDNVHYSDEETCAILKSGESERWNHVFQVCMYAWMLGDAQKTSLAYVDEEVCSVEQFSVGQQSMIQVEKMLRSYSEKRKKIMANKTPPPGAPTPQRCLHCPYRVGCWELLKKSTSFMSDFPNNRVPLVLPIKKINLTKNQLVLDDLNGSEIHVNLIGISNSRLTMTEQSIRRGADLIVYSEVFCDKTDPRSYNVIFAQRPEEWSPLS